MQYCAKVVDTKKEREDALKKNNSRSRYLSVNVTESAINRNLKTSNQYLASTLFCCTVYQSTWQKSCSSHLGEIVIVFLWIPTVCFGLDFQPQTESVMLKLGPKHMLQD